MRQLRASLAASFFICLLTIVAAAQDQTLQLGTPIERQLGPSETHTFSVTLEENQLIQFVVEQNGIDVVVRVYSPAGKSIGNYDSPNGDSGPENVSFIAAAPGAYRITVAPLNQDGPSRSGKYEIKIIELRPATEQEIKNSQNLEVVKAKGVALLGEIDALIPEIRTPQTRIKAQLKAAQIVWNVDEKRAAKYLSDAMSGVKEFLATGDTYDPENVTTFTVIAQVRFEIIQLAAGRDPDAALNFLYSSKIPFDTYGNQGEQAEQERGLELMIANTIAGKDPKRALQIARQNLKRGYSSSLIQTVSALRQQSPELATEFAGDIADKLLGEKLLKHPEAAALSISLVAACNDKQMRIQRPGREVAPAEPLLPEQVCRDLTQKITQEALSYSPLAANAYSLERAAAWGLLNGLQAMGQQLDAIVTGGVASVQKKLVELNDPNNPNQAIMQQFQTKLEGGPIDGALQVLEKAPEELKEQLSIQAAGIMAAKGDAAKAKQIINENVTNPYQRRQALANLEQQEMYQALSHGKVEEALRKIATLRTPRERANMLMQIAQQIGPGQKRANALNLLEQARSLLTPGPQAQDQEQMGALLELARAFSRYDSKRAFEIVDPLIDQFNDLCSAARALEGFGLEMYQHEELDLQNGSSLASMASQMSEALGTLAIANFERAKLTSDRLRLPEVRLRVYFAIAQQTIQESK